MTDPKNKMQPAEIVEAIFEDLRGRRFLKWLFDPRGDECYIGDFASSEPLKGLDLEVQAEIKAAWRTIIARAIPSPQSNVAGSATATSRAMLDVSIERHRQVMVEGFDASHDDMATKGQLATAAACYALQAGARGRQFPNDPQPIGIWPWDREWWKPSADHRRNLIKAAALIIAEIERLDRANDTKE